MYNIAKQFQKYGEILGDLKISPLTLGNHFFENHYFN